MFKFLNYKKEEDKTEDNSIFRTTNDIECVYLNKKSTHYNHYSKDQKGNICKFIDNSHILDWEFNVYLTFIQKNIFPLANSTQRHIIYYTNNLVSLRTFLIKYNINMTHLLHELFSFINHFKTFGFIHGNLHLDNIFIYPKSESGRLEFYVIDYTNSYISSLNNENMWSFPLYKRTSFLGDHYISHDLQKFANWDFITLYVSLKILFTNNIEYLCILDSTISNYIDINYLHNLMKKVLNK